jgi:hypothetical protein
MKSMEIDWHRSSGTGRGWRGLDGLEVELLFREHSTQDGM